MKAKLQELLRQLEIYRNEVNASKEFQKEQMDNKEELLRKELDFCMKQEKEKMLERQQELVYAYEEISEDLKMQKDDNQRLKDRINVYERQAPPRQQQRQMTTNSSVQQQHQNVF